MNADRVKVWDPLVRTFHWSLVFSVATTWLTAEDFRVVHEWGGYVVLALVAVRLLWGLVGSRYARFSQFVRGVKPVTTYARLVITGRAPRYIGHNPLGGWMMIALLLVLAALGTTGWMMSLDAFFGNARLETLHKTLANGLLAMIVLHVAGAVVTGVKHGENLVRAMVTGVKRTPATGDID